MLDWKPLAAALVLAGCTTLPQPGAAEFGRVRPGMSRDEAQQVLGAPAEKMSFPRNGTESWDYRFVDTWGYTALFSVIFGADGRVTGTVTQRLNDGGDHT